MKRRIFAAAILVSVVFGFNQCKEDVDLIGNSVETAVIVGMLNRSDNAHYIKVTRTFIGDGQTSALEIAQHPDSSYFENVEVVVTERLSNGSVGRTFVCNDTIIPNKETSGVFYSPDQKVYVFYTASNAKLIETATYELDVKVDGGRIHVQGETELVQGMTLASSIVGATKPFRFYDNSGFRNQLLEVSNVGNAERLNAKFKFYYQEYTSATDSVAKSFTWNLGDVALSETATMYTYEASGAIFYEKVRENIPVNPNVIKRRYTDVEILITGASRELSAYMAVNQPSNSLVQNKPSYTNLRVNEGFKVIGIFASRGTISEKKVSSLPSGIQQVRGLDQRTTEYLCRGPLTIDLEFCSEHTLDAVATLFDPLYSCPF